MLGVVAESLSRRTGFANGRLPPTRYLRDRIYSQRFRAYTYAGWQRIVFCAVMIHSRRTFGKLALAAYPLARGFAAVNSTFSGVRLGIGSYSFRGFGLDDVVSQVAAIPWGELELESWFVEPRVFIGGPRRYESRAEGDVTSVAAYCAAQRVRRDKEKIR